MRKKKKIKKHHIIADKKFNSVLVSKLINQVMRNGEKNKAIKIIYKTSNLLEEKEKNISFLSILDKAIENVRPSWENKSGGYKQKIPKKIEKERSIKLSLRWIVEESRKETKKNSKMMFENLFEEIMNAYEKKGNAYKKKQEEWKSIRGNMALVNIKQ